MSLSLSENEGVSLKIQMQVECTFIGIVFICLFFIASGLNGLVYIGIAGGHVMVMNWNAMDYAHGDCFIIHFL